MTRNIMVSMVSECSSPRILFAMWFFLMGYDADEWDFGHCELTMLRRSWSYVDFDGDTRVAYACVICFGRGK